MCSIYNLKGKDGNVKVMRELAAHTGERMGTHKNFTSASCGSVLTVHGSCVDQVTCPAAAS